MEGEEENFERSLITPRKLGRLIGLIVATYTKIAEPFDFQVRDETRIISPQFLPSKFRYFSPLSLKAIDHLGV